MAISATPNPREDGTIFGVPFKFSYEKYAYILPDGEEFARERYDEMTEYVMKNLPKFELAVLGEVSKKIKPPEPVMTGDWGDIIRAATEDMVDDLMDKAIRENERNATTASTASTASTGSTITVEKLVADIADAEQAIKAIKSKETQSRERANVRYQIEQENKKIQLKWDKDFNRRVLDIVRRCVEQGQVAVATYEKIGSYDPSVMNATTIGDKVKHHTITYPRGMSAAEAYMNVREQVEKVVKTTTEPPRLHRIP